MSNDNRTAPLLFLALFLLVTGGLLSTARGTQVYLTRFLLLGGVVTILLVLLRSAPTLRFFLGRFRTVAEPGPSLNWLLAATALLVGSAALGIQAVRYDWTRQQVNRLTPVSRDILAQLEQDVELIGAFRDELPQRDAVREQLTVYRAESNRISIKLFDPERSPDEAREYGVTRPNVIVVRSGAVHEEIEEFDEPSITQAILRVADPKRPVVMLVLGHGEVAEDRPPFHRLRQVLTEGGLRWESIRLAEVAEVPDAVRVLLIAGPRTPITPGEVGAIDRFLERGGRVAIALEPSEPTGLESLLVRRGIQIDGRKIRDASNVTRSLGLGPEVLAVAQLGEHPTTREIRSLIVLRGTTGVSVAPKPVWGTNGANLLRSGPESVYLAPRERPGTGEVGRTIPAAASDSAFMASATSRAYVDDSPPMDQLEPATSPESVPMAAALEWEVTRSKDAGLVPEKPYARLVVIGDSDWLRDGTIELYGNTEFVGRVFGWLAEREFLLRFPPRDASGTPLEVGLSGLRTSFLVVQILLPLLAFGFGFFLWMRRR